MILAMTELQESIRTDLSRTTAACAIQAHDLGGQIIDPDQPSAQIGLKGIPTLIISQVIEHACQMIITPVQSTGLLVQIRLQLAQMLLCPRFGMIELMVALRENMTEPSHTHLPQAQSSPVPMRHKVLI